MRKTYPLRPEGKHPDRVLEAVKHDIRKYFKRERRRELPEGADFWDFDCSLGATKGAAEAVRTGELIGQLDALAKTGVEACYVEVLTKPGVRQPRPAGEQTPADTDADGVHPAQSLDAPDPDSPEDSHS